MDTKLCGNGAEGFDCCGSYVTCGDDALDTTSFYRVEIVAFNGVNSSHRQITLHMTHIFTLHVLQ